MMQAEPTADQTEELLGGLGGLGFLVSCVVGRRHFRTCEGETSNVTDFWNMSGCQPGEQSEAPNMRGLFQGKAGKPFLRKLLLWTWIKTP